MSFNLNRRGFLQSAAGGVLGVAAAGLGARQIARINEALAAEQVSVPGGPENWAPAVCNLCPAGCGLRVRTIGKRAVKIQGNPLHPVNHGGLCPKGLAGLQALYHPDRLRAPVRNVGSRQSPRWKQITWEDALGDIATRLRALRRDGQAHTLAFLDNNRASLQSRLFRRFVGAFGSPNYLVMPSGLDCTQAAAYLQQGATRPVAYDLENSAYVLSFGANLLEGWGAPTSVMRAFSRWRDASAGRRAKFVQVEPRLSTTAARADEWIPVRPGTEAALALGIAYVLVAEGLYDHDFVNEHTFGFDDWRDEHGATRMGFRSLVAAEYRLNDVSQITGVPPETIVRLAREFGHNKPALALGGPQSSTLPGAPYAAMAVHSLNALAGSIDAPGGVLLQASSPLEETETSSDSEHPRLDQPSEQLVPLPHAGWLPKAILSKRPYPLGALILNEANPVFMMPNGEEFRRAFAEVPFIVSFAAFLDDTSALADVVLPACTGLERWQEASAPPAFPYALHSISAPVVAPRHGSRNPADVVLELARSLRDPVAAALPYPDFEQYLKSQTAKLFDAKTGDVFSPTLEQNWNRMLERAGWWAPSYSSADELWEQIKQNGGWWDPVYSFGEWDRVLRTPSHRFEFSSQALARFIAERPQGARESGLRTGDDRALLPRQPQSAAAPQVFPLLLLPVETLPLCGATGAHLPYVQQIAGPQLFAQWDSWLEIHPDTAAKLAIADGDVVMVESSRAKARVVARLHKGVRPDVVCMPLGYGQASGSPWACRGVNPLRLMEERREPLIGLHDTRSTYVKVYRA